MQLYIKASREVGQVIKGRRKAAKVTQGTLAIKLGITQGALSRIERGKLESYLPANQFCEALGIDAPIFTGEPDAYAEAKSIRGKISEALNERCEQIQNDTAI